MDQYIGKSLDRYQILSLLGEGGMGSVYRAHDPRLDRDVAIKLMHAYLSRQPSFQERFLQEARAAARLNHPGIVKVHDSGQAEEVLYIVMELLPGDNLKVLLERMKTSQQWPSITEAAHLIRLVSIAVEYSHQHGVFFRDIKPDNIMFKDEAVEDLPYRPVLTDLGLAKLAEEIPITREGESMGTPSYMSPEQALGHPTDARSDIYSLGVLFFELATGALPFEVKSLAEAIHYHTKMPPPSPRFLNPAIPAAIEDILLKSLQKDPARRFQTAAEMAEAIASSIPPKERTPSDGKDTQQQTFTLMTQYQSSLAGEKVPSQLLGTLTPPDDLPYDRIQIVSRGHTARFVYIRGGAMTIGRADDNDIVLPDMNISQHHARVEYDGKDYYIVDLKSTNGIFQEGAKLLPGLPVVWQPGKLMQIGDYWLQLDLARKSYIRLPVNKDEEAGTATIVDTGDGQNLPFTMPGDIKYQLAATETFKKVPVEPASPPIPPVQPPPVKFELEVLPNQLTSAVEGRFSIYLSNQGASSLILNLYASSVEEDLHYGFEQSQVSLPAGEEQGKATISLTVRSTIPNSTGKTVSHRFSVTACPAEAPELASQIPVEWIQPVPQINLRLDPSRGQRGDARSFTVLVQNDSLDELTVQLSAKDAWGLLAYEFQTQQIRLLPGKEASIPLKVIYLDQRSTDGNIPTQFSVFAKLMEVPAYTVQTKGEWGEVQVEESGLKQKFFGPPYLGAWILMILGWMASPIVYGIIRRFICEDCIRAWAYSTGMGEGESYIFLIIIYDAAVGLMYGLVTGIALRIANRSLSLGSILLLTLSWGIAISGSFYLLFSLNEQPVIFCLINYVLPAAIGGLVTGLVLMRTRVDWISFLQALSIMIAWSIGRAIGITIIGSTGGYYSGEISQEVIVGIITAAIGGGWTLFMMYRSRSRRLAVQAMTQDTIQR